MKAWFYTLRNSGIFSARRFPLVFLLLFFSLINPDVSDLKANVIPENSISRTCPTDIFNIHFLNFKAFVIRENIPFKPVPKNDPVNKAVPQAPSDQCYFKEGHRLIADKGPETAIIAFSGIKAGYPFLQVSFVSQTEFTWISQWNYNCSKIRPPPSY